MHKFQVGNVVEQQGDSCRGRQWLILAVNKQYGSRNPTYRAKVVRLCPSGDYRDAGEIAECAYLESGSLVKDYDVDSLAEAYEQAEKAGKGDAFLDSLKGTVAIKVFFAVSLKRI